jgi:hypothetical protein
VRIVQYSVAALDTEMLGRIAALAVADVATAFARDVEKGLRSSSVEPTCLVRVGRPEGGIALDASGAPIPLARHEDAGAVTAALEALGRGEPEWLFGRWSFTGDEASLVPLSCSVSGHILRLR